MIQNIPIKVEYQENDFPLTAEHKTAISTILEDLKDKPGSLLPILHQIQDQLSYIPQGALPLIARQLNLSRAEVYGVVSFYHHFRTELGGKHIIYICRAEACQAMGSVNLEKYIKNKLNIDFHQTTQDGQFTVEPVYCLGNCACSPAIRINDDIHGRVTTDKVDHLLKQHRLLVEQQ